MLKWFDFLSGEIPGGLVVLIVFLLSVYLTFHLLKNSELISKKAAKNRQWLISLFIILIYFTLWNVLRPPQPRVRIMALPTYDRSGSILNDEKAFIVPELVNQLVQNPLKNRYMIHRWEWTYETLAPDSINNIVYWDRLGREIQPGVLITSELQDEGTVIIRFLNKKAGDSLTVQSRSMNWTELKPALSKAIEALNLLKAKNTGPAFSENNYLSFKLDLLCDKFDHIIEKNKGNNHPDAISIYSNALLQKGLSVEIDREKGQYTGYKNAYFDEIKNLIYPLIQKKQDPPEAAIILGRIALWEEKFEDADIYFKKALSDDPLNSRIYYYLSSLLTTRLRELDFESRAESLERAVELDPGYNHAVYALAQEYYFSGTGTQTGLGTTSAMRVMENYLKLNSDNPKILSLLATTYLRTDRIDAAYEIYKQLQPRFPDDSNLYYNLGIVEFRKKDYKAAIEYFMRAIEIDGNLDAFLYTGLTYRMMGENDSALVYYRERVRRKTGDDDTYAKEAMAGIRAILEEEKTADSLQGTLNEN